MSNVNVFYLLRKNNESLLFYNFANSYIKYDSGYNHKLYIIFKGYKDGNIPKYVADYSKTNKFIFKGFFIDDTGFDIDAYYKASQSMRENDLVFFFNSYSIILTNNWLSLFIAAYSKNNSGIIGATSSYASLRPRCSNLKLLFVSLTKILKVLISDKNIINIFDRIYSILLNYFFAINFNSFKNPHIRTNAFLICARYYNDTYENFKRIKNKNDCYIFESGKTGLSNSILRKGFDLITVDKKGRSFNQNNFDSANVFWNSNQENLIVSDNVTRLYDADPNPNIKNILYNHAWTTGFDAHDQNYWKNVTNKITYLKLNKLRKNKLLEMSDINIKRNLIIYGAGTVGTYYHNWITSKKLNLDILFFIDSNKKLSPNNSQNCFKPSYLFSSNIQYDKILIASNQFYQEIHRILLKNNVPNSKII